MNFQNKALVLRTKQLDHILGERRVLHDIAFPFIVNMYASFQDDTYLYMVLEYSIGTLLCILVRCIFVFIIRKSFGVACSYSCYSMGTSFVFIVLMQMAQVGSFFHICARHAGSQMTLLASTPPASCSHLNTFTTAIS
jgi:hypothetical protein